MQQDIYVALVVESITLFSRLEFEFNYPLSMKNGVEILHEFKKY